MSLNAWTSVPSKVRKRLRQNCFARARGHCQIRLPGVCDHHPGCTWCAQELDHIVEVANGGSLLDPRNHRAACRPCNRHRKRPSGEIPRRPSREW